MGRAGQLLTKMLESVQLSRDEVYITNTVKCFISPRVLIYTPEGYRPIKDLRVGDLVLTHRGTFRKVVYVRPREILPKGSPVIRISVRADEGNQRPVHLTVTPEHPFLIDGAWKPARDIQRGDRLDVLGDRCEVCGRTYFVRYDRYDRRSYRTCSYRCHNLRIFHSAEARQNLRLTVKAQYANGARDPLRITRRANERTRELVAGGLAGFGESALQLKERLAREYGEEILRRLLKNHSGGYVFLDGTVAEAQSLRTGRAFPLYNIGVEDDESYVAAGLVSHNCRPPGNRNPEPDELLACAPFLAAQLAQLQPKVILSLGSVATQALLGTREPIGKLRGRLHPYGSAVLIPTFHPAFLLRNPGQEYKRMAWEDLKLAKREYDRRRAGT
ncbi:MAG: Hint domain-containing protein [Candidatus Rokubacteria bacterium]|nr:Hint domain-containing protein [Candidatus Rokubacteria bacterium]